VKILLDSEAWKHARFCSAQQRVTYVQSSQRQKTFDNLFMKDVCD